MNKVWSFNAVLTFDATLESERVFGIFRRFMKVASYIQLPSNTLPAANHANH